MARLNYYECLGLRPTCDYLEVRDAFHTRAQRYHSDRFVDEASAPYRAAAYEVYKRISEAYQVLFDPELRAVYDGARLRGQVRLTEAERARRLEGAEIRVHNPFARIYLRAARAKLNRGDLRGAWIDVRLGLSLEDAPPLREVVEELRAHPHAAAMIGFAP